MSRATQRRSSSSDDEGGGANWMDTYGDLVTLLLTFFVFLFAFSSVDASKWERIASSFTGRTIFAVPSMDMSTVTAPITPSFNSINEEYNDSSYAGSEDFQELLNNITEYISGNDLEAELLATPETNTMILRFAANVLFNSGSADITAEFRPTMDHLVSMFAASEELINMIRIEGHTDNVPISTAEFADNWDLSVKRATNVLHYCIASHLMDVTKISAAGYGEFHPVADNDTPENRAQNRRVDFVIESNISNNF